jgi:hypothetical protein
MRPIMPNDSRGKSGRGWLCVAGGAVLAAGLLLPAVAGAQKKDDQTTSAFMRKKLDASSKILEGLALEDAALLRTGSEAILEMSKAEKWNVIVDAEYRELNREFRSAVRKLQDAAAAGNFDNATLQWFDAVKGCVECHKHVRQPNPAKK